MRKVESIKQKRVNAHIRTRLAKGREVELERDVKEVRRDIALIRSPAAGLKERKKLEEEEEEEDEQKDVEMEEQSDIEMESESDEEPKVELVEVN